jgi:hypothetical protein
VSCRSTSQAELDIVYGDKTALEGPSQGATGRYVLSDANIYRAEGVSETEAALSRGVLLMGVWPEYFSLSHGRRLESGPAPSGRPL